ncbi:MAG: uridine diphosphate-N-acetylglucosamine-binding protein YvcK [Patescibacteria group bacterium]
MLGTFLRHYLELPQENKKIVCLGGGVGTSQILAGLRKYEHEITAIVSMADDGGSAGRLRRAFQVPPPGDLINCLAALSDEESIVRNLFLYRFEGKRQGKDTDLGGQKLGNLIFVALTEICKGDTNKALEELSKIISSRGRVLPATMGDVNIWAKAKNGKKIYGEKNIDLGKYNGTRTLDQVYLDPPNIKAYKHSLAAIGQSDLIVAGPGDLFSTVLPVLIVPEIKKALRSTNAKKVFIVNIANKPFETARFKVSNYLEKINSHLGDAIFDTILVNTNQRPKIPTSLKYGYVEVDQIGPKNYNGEIIKGDFVNEKYPLYHDSKKVADKIISILK